MDKEKYMTSRQKFTLALVGIIAFLFMVLGWTAAITVSSYSDDRKQTQVYTECIKAGKQVVDGNCIDKGLAR